MQDGEMQHDGDDSESDFEEYEVISVNPNINYETDEDEEVEEEVKIEKAVVEPPKVDETVVKSPKVDTEMSVDKFEDASCDMDENSSDSVKKVRKKLNLEEYKMRRANEKPSEHKKPLFDLPKKIAAYELCDVPASLPMLILPTDSASFLMMSGEEVKHEYQRPAFNPDLYEEITLVSMGCNTDITMSPDDAVDEQKPATNCLKSIVNNLNKDTQLLLSSSTSLFSSIQAVVQGKCLPTETCEVPEANNDTNEHGEDKIIMHLRKDRLRPFKCTASVQTDNHSLFPALLLPPSHMHSRVRNARTYRRKISRSRSRSRSYSPVDEDYERMKCHKRYSRSQHSTHSSSLNSSSSSGSGSESDSDSSSYSSADSLKHFNDRHNFRFYDRNQSYRNYTEERKVIYIGHLEEETTKEEIRRKFLKYGTIKKISLHAKEDGMRYGFVTFAEAQCAYEVIDKFTKDSLICNYDIRFGGRRKFCKQTYADLDKLAEEKEYAESQKAQKDLSFEDLLLLAKKKLSAKK